MKAIVTGAEGFIGRALAEKLNSLGIKVQRADLADYESGALTKILREAESDTTVYLLGARADVAFSAMNPVSDAEMNLVPTVTQILAAKRARVVFASTFGGMFDKGEIHDAVNEDEQPTPTAPYFVGKLAAEHYLRLINPIGGWVALRLANVYGPSAKGRGVVHDWMTRMASGEPLDVWGDLEATRAYIYIDDVVDAFVRAGSRGEGIIHIAPDERTALRALSNLMAVVSGLKPGFDFEDAHTGYIQHGAVADNHRAYLELGWRPTVELKEGLWRTWQGYR